MMNVDFFVDEAQENRNHIQCSNFLKENHELLTSFF